MLDRWISSILDPSQTPVLVGLIAFISWAFTEKLLSLFGFHQPEAPQKERLSFRWLRLSWHGAVTFSFLDAVGFHWTTISPRLSSVQHVSISLLVVGIAVRVVSRLALGEQFSGHVQTAKSHRLIKCGIYSMIRHPAYLGYLCLLVGFPLCFGSIAGFGCAVVSGIPALIYRIRIEERALLQWFGDEYQEYRRKTSRLVPLLW